MSISSISNFAPQVAAAAPPVEARLSTEQRSVIQAAKTVDAAGVFGEENQVTYSIDRNTHQVVVKVTNRQTHQVVDQIPAEYVLQMAEELKGD